MKLVGGIASHVGNVREVNQDRAYFGDSLAAVADGMGGHQGGEIAAQVAVSGFDGLAGPVECDELLSLVSDANSAVFEKAIDPDLRGMGTTLVVLALQPEGDVVTIANVGDSRAYHYLDGTLRQVTVDHSLVQDLVTAGKITEEEAHIHPQRNIVTRALGISPTVEADSFTLPARIGDRFLLCTDGLINEVDEAAISEILEGEDPVAVANSLVQAAIDEAGRDNVTVAVIDVVEGTPEPAVDEVEVEQDDDPTVPLKAVSAEVDQGEEVDSFESDDTALDDDAEGESSDIAEVDPDDEQLAAEGISGEDESAGQDSADHDSADQGSSHQRSAGQDEDEIEPLPETLDPAKKRGAKILLGGVVAAAIASIGFFAVSWYAENSWYIGEEDGKVAIYNGRPGGFLWFGSQTESVSDIDIDDLDEASRQQVEDNLTAGSFEEAQEVVEGLTQSSRSGTATGEDESNGTQEDTEEDGEAAGSPGAPPQSGRPVPPPPAPGNDVSPPSNP